MAVNLDINSVEELGGVVRYHRKQANLSRVALAEIAGVGKTVIYDVEKGKTTIQLNTLLKIFHVLNISFHMNSPLMPLYKETKDAKS